MPVETPEAALKGFDTILSALDTADRAGLEAVAAATAQPATEAAREPDFSAPSHVADRALALSPGQARDRMRRALVARWALDLPQRIDRMHLPQTVTGLIPDALSRLAGFLTSSDGPYDEDFWAKDVRYVLGLTVPVGGQVVDLYARVGPGEVLRHSLSRRDPGPVLTYALSKGWGPWLQIHTESRHLDHFNAEGWDAAFRRSAAILKTRPDLCGLMGSSWFYDPPLAEISPRLAYLREGPTSRGAALVHQGVGETYTIRCTETSPTRRKLVEEGKYTPRSWMILWPRADMIRWADGLDAEAAAAAEVQAAA